jgi:hypothetical protein
MSWPENVAVVAALGLASAQTPGKIRRVELLSYKGELKRKQDNASLKVEMPGEKYPTWALR